MYKVNNDNLYSTNKNFSKAESIMNHKVSAVIYKVLKNKRALTILINPM